jgi:hypothetical protein
MMMAFPPRMMIFWPVSASRAAARLRARRSGLMRVS